MRTIYVGLIAFMVLATGLASADIDPNLDEYNLATGADITSAGNPPAIEGAFVLTDEDPIAPGTQIWPIPGTGTTQNTVDIYKYVIVSDPNGMNDIAAVFEKLYGPSGAQVGVEETALDITYTAEQTDALNEALASGLIDQTQYDYYVWLLDPLKKQAKMYRVINTLTNCDDPGIYSVVFKAVDNGGANTGYIPSTTFEYLGLSALEMDFTAVNYGAITVNVEKWVAGDDVFLLADGKPTVKNQGNVPFRISVQASDLTGAQLGQTIPAEALSVELLGEHVYGLATPVVLIGCLEPCTPTQISFDITAPLGTAADSYSGTMDILIAEECPGDISPP